jgi:ADP-ribose pyrophosphatase YjhB (NUDIX family)
MRYISPDSPVPGRRLRVGVPAHVDRVRCVLRHQQKYLLVQHHSRRAANFDKWRLPGGKLKAHEEPKAGLRRELAEELRFRVAYLVELGDWWHRNETQRVFGCEIARAIRRFDGEEIRALDWFTYPEVVEIGDEGLLHTGFELEAITEFQRRFPT